ncbi:MAG: methylated-DNA--[protein]-cysteine S-methyltransferase [Spirochaetaceae bacterium]|jgi:methylated-DNA-[protein]-cysteine S-methyltransferase|nr:methylated-DNA--[protein]-cysteine S-methyltransferase [Spirochaetaceae bacterium]
MNTQNLTTIIDSPLGCLRACADPSMSALIRLDFLNTPQEPCDTDGDIPVFSSLRRWLDAYFEGEAPPVTIPLLFHGSAFQRTVWDSLRQIPYGHTTSYGTLAQQLQTSARAVGGAVGCNPLSILVPCHRVIGSDGSLTGYGGGIERKIALLVREGIPIIR